MNINEKVKNCGKMMKTFSDAFSYTISDSPGRGGGGGGR